MQLLLSTPPLRSNHKGGGSELVEVCFCFERYGHAKITEPFAQRKRIKKGLEIIWSMARLVVEVIFSFKEKEDKKRVKISLQ